MGEGVISKNHGYYFSTVGLVEGQWNGSYWKDSCKKLHFGLPMNL